MFQGYLEKTSSMIQSNHHHTGGKADSRRYTSVVVRVGRRRYFFKKLRLRTSGRTSSDTGFGRAARNMGVDRMVHSFITVMTMVLAQASSSEQNGGLVCPTDGVLRANHLATFPLLEDLDLQKCNLTAIDHNALHNMTRLRKLNLNHNNLEHLSNDIFLGLHQLKSVSLAENPLLHLEEREKFPASESITFIDIRETNITQANAAMFSTVKNLKYLNAPGRLMCSRKNRQLVPFKLICKELFPSDEITSTPKYTVQYNYVINNSNMNDSYSINGTETTGVERYPTSVPPDDMISSTGHPYNVRDIINSTYDNKSIVKVGNIENAGSSNGTGTQRPNITNLNSSNTVIYYYNCNNDNSDIYYIIIFASAVVLAVLFVQNRHYYTKIIRGITGAKQAINMEDSNSGANYKLVGSADWH